MSKLIWVVILFLLPLAVSHNIGGNALIFQNATTIEKVEWPLAVVEETTEHGPGVFYGKAKRTFFIEAASGMPLGKLVDLSLFGEFRPAMTIEQAAARFGPPVRILNQSDATYSVYESKSARIEVADQLQGSSCGTYHRRTLYAYPKQPSHGCSLNSAKLFHASINTHIPESDSIEVGVAEAGKGQRVWVLVHDGCIEALNWWAPPSLDENSER